MNKNNVLRLWQVVLAVTLWAATMAAPAGAQSTEPFNFSADIAPSVESFKMTQFGSVAPSLYTGAMTYSLPLYTYQDEDFTIPISLEYSYDGYKPSQHSGTVGLGWALNCGGVITREVRGYPDDSYDLNESIRGYFYTTKEIFHSIYPWEIYNSKIRYAFNQGPENFSIDEEDVFTDTPIYTTTHSIIYGTGDTRYDPSPDLFHFSVPGYHGDFMCDDKGNLKVFNTENAGTFMVEYDDTSWECPRFIITSGDGYTYYFGGRDRGVEYTLSSPDPVYPKTPVAWHLYKIQAPNGKTVEFVFDEHYSSEVDVTMFRPADLSGQAIDYGSFGTAIRDYEPSVSCRRIPLLRSVRVNGKDMVDFDYEVCERDESAASCFNRSDEVEQSFFDPPYSLYRRHLKKVEVKDTYGMQVMAIQLEKLFTYQSYGMSSRMFLTSVNSSRDGEYGFTYKDVTSQTLFPANNTESVDHWGYWTYARCDSLLRHINVNTSVSLYQQLDTATFKEPRLPSTIKGALETITYPTGGRSEIGYELNTVSRLFDRSASFGPILRDNDLNWKAGGLRVNRIVNVDGERRDTVRYEYNNPCTLQSSGIQMQMPRYGTRIGVSHIIPSSGDGFSTVFQSVQTGFSDALSHGQPRDPAVGYGYVRECRQDGSSILYHFLDYSVRPDYYPGMDTAIFLNRTKTGQYDYVGSWGYGTAQSGIAQLMLPARDDYRNVRGNLASKTEYGADGLPRNSTVYDYSSENGFSNESVFNGLIWFVKMRQTFKCPVLTSVTEKKFEGGDSLSIRSTFAYDTLGRKVQECVISSVGEVGTKYQYYSYEMTTCPSHLRRSLSAVAQTRTDDTGLYLLQTERYAYDASTGNPRPVQIDTYSAEAPQAASSFTNLFEAPAGYKHKTVGLTYDSSSQRLLRADLPGGAYIAYTWDTAGKHILTKTVSDALNTWTYSWKDGVGLSSVKQPTGKGLEYYYDVSNRLALIRDESACNIESYQYHFTNE